MLEVFYQIFVLMDQFIGQWPDMVYFPHQGEFCRPWFLEASCLASFWQYVSLLAMEALPSNSPLHMLPTQRHKFNIKRTEVRIHVNICRCSIKKIFYLIVQSISYKYWPLRIHLGLTWCHAYNIFIKPCKNGYLKLNSSFCKLFVAIVAKHLQEYKRKFIYLSKTATIIILSYILLK